MDWLTSLIWLLFLASVGEMYQRYLTSDNGTASRLLEQLLQACERYALGVVKGATSDRDDREDVLQCCRIAIHRSLIRFREHCKSMSEPELRGYMIAVAEREVTEYHRRERRVWYLLQKRMIYIFDSPKLPRLARWRDATSGQFVGGLSKWQRANPQPEVYQVCPSDALYRCRGEALANREPKELEDWQLVEGILDWLGRPVNINALTDLLFDLKELQEGTLPLVEDIVSAN